MVSFDPSLTLYNLSLKRFVVVSITSATFAAFADIRLFQSLKPPQQVLLVVDWIPDFF